MSENENGTTQTTRLCHVIKKENFDGYGFNLHAEKGKPGQYIGKVDDGSPAELSGLKQGDRILEVNGCSIGNETHKQVVHRIKALSNEVQLLVIDSNVAITSDNRIVEAVSSSNGNVPNNGNFENTEMKNKNASEETTIGVSIQQETSNDTIDTVEHEQKSSVTSMKSESNDLPTIPPKISSEPENQNEHNSGSNNSTITGNSNNTNTAKEGLNLNMTAAELRAKLAAKKKFDPKSDAVDLRQKFEIIQKL